MVLGGSDGPNTWSAARKRNAEEAGVDGADSDTEDSDDDIPMMTLASAGGKGSAGGGGISPFEGHADDSDSF